MKSEHMFNVTYYMYLLFQPRKVIIFSLVAHKDSVSIRKRIIMLTKIEFIWKFIKCMAVS